MVLKLTLKDSYPAKPTKDMLLAFHANMQKLMEREVPYLFSSKLYHYLSPTYFDKSPEDRYSELFVLRLNSNFEALLQMDENLAYLFLIKSINHQLELIEQMKTNRLGREFLIPMELEPYRLKLAAWLKIRIPESFSNGMYHYLSSNFFDKTPEERLDELNALSQKPDFMSYLEPNQTTYLFLKKSVHDLPHLIAALKKTALGQHYLIPRELELFNQTLTQWMGVDVSRAYSDELFKHLGLEFFSKTAEEKLEQLCEVRKATGFMTGLLVDKTLSDQFLRKSLNDSPELIARLRMNRLGQQCLIPSPLRLFYHKIAHLMGEEVSRNFADELFRHLSKEFFDKTPQFRYLELCRLRTNSEFFNCLMEDKIAANTFLRKAMDESPQWIDQLKSNRLGQYCLLPDRKVRKRKLESFPQAEAAERKAYFDYLAANRQGSLFPQAVPERDQTNIEIPESPLKAIQS